MSPAWRSPSRRFVLLPAPVEPEAHDVVHDVVTAREAREHRAHLWGPLIVVGEILVPHGAIVGGAVSLRRPGAGATHPRSRARRGGPDGLSLPGGHREGDRF